jgi:hypothetical protein
MTASPYWEDDPKAWSTGVIGPYVLPGVVSVDTGDIAKQLERRKPKGKSGGALVNNGYKPIKTKIILKYQGRANHEKWLALVPRINPRREGSEKEPLQFRHPLVDEFDLGPWVIAGINPGMPSSRGGRTITILIEEWFPDTKKVKAAAGTVKPAVDDYRQHIADQVVAGELFEKRENFWPPDPSTSPALNSMMGDLTGTSRE